VTDDDCFVTDDYCFVTDDYPLHLKSIRDNIIIFNQIVTVSH
jgi:hypothetical protein